MHPILLNAVEGSFK